MNRRIALAVAVALLAALAAGPVLAPGVGGREAAAAQSAEAVVPPPQDGGTIALPLQTFVGYVRHVSSGDLPRFELAGAGPYKSTTYVLLVPANLYAPLADYVKPRNGQMLSRVKITGAKVLVPSLRGTRPGIMVKSVELYEAASVK